MFVDSFLNMYPNLYPSVKKTLLSTHKTHIWISTGAKENEIYGSLVLKEIKKLWPQSTHNKVKRDELPGAQRITYILLFNKHA